MIARTPAAAVLWECWRLSRFSLATVMFCSTIAGGAVLLSPGYSSPRGTMVLQLAILFALVTNGWTVGQKGRTGFGMALGFTRPIPTWLLVSVPMVYVGVTAACAYVIPMVVLSAAFGIPFLLVGPASLIATATVMIVASRWWTGSRALRIARFLIICLVALISFILGSNDGSRSARGGWTEILTLSPESYLALGMLALASIAVATFGVARQRRGDDGFAREPRVAAAGAGVSRPLSWLSELVRLSCPVSSPGVAQLWYETRITGARIFALGLAAAIAMSVVLVVATYTGKAATYFSVTAAMMAAPLIPLIAGVRGVLGVRHKEGLTYVDAFEVVRPVGTSRLIGLKVVVTSLALLLSWTAIGIASWMLVTPLSRIARDPDAAEFIGDLLEIKEELIAGFLSTSPVELVLSAVIIVAYVATLIAFAAIVQAFFLRNARAVIGGGQIAAVYLVGLIYLSTTGVVTNSALLAHLWVVTAAAALVSIYVCRRALLEHVLERRGVIVLLTLYGAVAALVFFVERSSGIPGNLWAPWALMMILPLVAAVLAPWSFSRIRHS